MVKNPNISGIIHSIIRLVDACLASIDGIVVIFCISHIETPTRIGRTGVGSGSAKSNHRNALFNGICSCKSGTQE